MSAIIAKLLGWTKAPQWVLELILCLLVVAGIGYWHHSTYNAGIAAQVAKDNAATLKSVVAANRETDRLKHIADVAEKEHADEHQQLLDYQRDHRNSVRLCLTPSAGAGLPTASGTAQTATGSGATGIQQMPVGDTPDRQGAAGQDIGGMLDALAASADAVSGDLREHQHRE